MKRPKWVNTTLHADHMQGLPHAWMKVFEDSNWFVWFDDLISGVIVIDAFSLADTKQQMQRWIDDNCQGQAHVSSDGVAFEREDDALMCFMAFR